MSLSPHFILFLVQKSTTQKKLKRQRKSLISRIHNSNMNDKNELSNFNLLKVGIN
jgi:hypothetical protein